MPLAHRRGTRLDGLADRAGALHLGGSPPHQGAEERRRALVPLARPVRRAPRRTAAGAGASVQRAGASRCPMVAARRPSRGRLSRARSRRQRAGRRGCVIGMARSHARGPSRHGDEDRRQCAGGRDPGGRAHPCACVRGRRQGGLRRGQGGAQPRPSRILPAGGRGSGSLRGPGHDGRAVRGPGPRCDVGVGRARTQAAGRRGLRFMGTRPRDAGAGPALCRDRRGPASRCPTRGRSPPTRG